MTMLASSQNIYDYLICNQYRLIKFLGRGTYGQIYLGYNERNQERVAVKVEPVNIKFPSLNHEYKVYTALGRCIGIPNVRWYGQVGNFYVLVMDLLGPSLEYLFNYCSRTFSAETIVLIADQMLDRLEYIHRRNIIHRDLKPENFLVGCDPTDNLLFLIDFGLAKQYSDPRTGEHIANREVETAVGTIRYMSVNSHRFEQSRRDDLESLGYALLYFARNGRLPWQDVKSVTKKQHLDMVKEKKMSLPIQQICWGCCIESSLTWYLEYCRKLKFEDSPNYEYLRYLFCYQLHKPLNYDNFDWVIQRKTGSHYDDAEHQNVVGLPRLDAIPLPPPYSAIVNVYSQNPGVVLQPANLQSVNLQPANLQPANLQPANLQPVNLQPANTPAPAGTIVNVYQYNPESVIMLARNPFLHM